MRVVDPQPRDPTRVGSQPKAPVASRWTRTTFGGWTKRMRQRRRLWHHDAPTPERPIDPVTLDEAALILGCSRSGVRRLIASGRLPSTDRYRHRQLARADVEALALRIYRWRQHLNDVDPYWLTGQRAAVVLGVNVTRLNQLVARGFVSFEVHADGTRLYRREQLAVVAKARDARWRHGPARRVAGDRSA